MTRITVLVPLFRANVVNCDLRPIQTGSGSEVCHCDPIEDLKRVKTPSLWIYGRGVASTLTEEAWPESRSSVRKSIRQGQDPHRAIMRSVSGTLNCRKLPGGDV